VLLIEVDIRARIIFLFKRLYRMNMISRYGHIRIYDMGPTDCLHLLKCVCILFFRAADKDYNDDAFLQTIRATRAKVVIPRGSVAGSRSAMVSGHQTNEITNDQDPERRRESGEAGPWQGSVPNLREGLASHGALIRFGLD
jgi:hypothetical protein